MKQWIAHVGKQFSIGGYVRGGVVAPLGTVTLNAVMVNAGVHDGRQVDVRIEPETLDLLAEIVTDAIAVRDGILTTGKFDKQRAKRYARGAGER